MHKQTLILTASVQLILNNTSSKAVTVSPLTVLLS